MTLVAEVRLPRPLPYQRTALDAPQRYKAWRWGRRCGKTLAGVIAAIAGHGPGRALRGILHGAPIVWLTPDYPQAREVWRTQVRRRLAGLPIAQISETERRVDTTNGGSLEIRSAEAVDGIRGRRLGGVIVDEAAWLDLEYAWQDVLRPALADLEGWALFISTPNAGHDGNSLKRTPSFFNRLCKRIQAGELDPEHWGEDHRRTRDNPTIPPAEITQMYGEYPPDSPVLQQELDALLLEAGAGIAFSDFDRSIHVQRIEPEHDNRYAWSGGLDWGYRTHGWFGLFAQGPDADCLLRWEYPFRERPPYDVGFSLGQQLRRFPRPEWIAADSAMWAVTDGGLTIAERVQAGLKDACGDAVPALIAAPKGRSMDGGKSHRVAAILQMHQLLGFRRDEDGTIQPMRRPRFLVHPDCVYWLRTVPSLPIDQKRPEDLDTTCFRGRECFLTPAGQRSFREAEGTSGVAWTRFGWMPYAWCKRKAGVSPVVEVGFDDDTRVVCTADHRFLTVEGEWVPASDLAGRFCMTARSGGPTRRGTTGTDGVSSFIAGYGSTWSAPFPWGTRSTTWTATGTTTSWPTCSVSPRQSTGGLSPAKATPRLRARSPVREPRYFNAWNVAPSSLPRPCTGTEPSTVPVRVWAGLGTAAAWHRQPAPFVGGPSCEVASGGRARPVGTAVAGSFVVSVKPLPQPEPVFCINVPGVREFVLASGHVVHNSEDHAWDGTMYWLLCRPPIRELEENVPFSRNKHPGLDRRGRRKPYPGTRRPAEAAAWELEEAVQDSEGRLWGYRYHGGQDLHGLVEVEEDYV